MFQQLKRVDRYIGQKINSVKKCVTKYDLRSNYRMKLCFQCTEKIWGHTHTHKHLENIVVHNTRFIYQETKTYMVLTYTDTLHSHTHTGSFTYFGDPTIQILLVTLP